MKGSKAGRKGTTARSRSTKPARARRAAAIDTRDRDGLLAALDRAQGTIEFKLDGTIETANENFLRLMGYSLDEVRGKHHRIFCDPSYVASPAYEAFWAKLRRGEYETGVYRRLGKNDKEVWILASYSPVLDSDGRAYKVVKIATDVTEQRNRSAEFEGRMNAIDKAQATIEFNLDGTVLTANENFLRLMGYSLDEVRGRHHRVFCEPAYANSAEYEAFWTKLRRGEHDTGVYRRIGKDNKEVWIQASYNPIFTAAGKPYKVVKFATDITGQRRAQDELGHLMEEVQSVMGAVATGDLTQMVSGQYKDGLDKIKVSINSAVEKLRDLVLQINESTSTIASAASDISEGNANLSKRTQEQSSALEETASSLEEMTATVKQNADNATQANQLAAGARDAAEKGGQVVGAGGRRDGRDHRVVEEDRRHHRRDRADRLPDQHAGAERRGRGGARRRSGPRLRGGRGRGAQPGAAQRGGGQGDQGADPGQRRRRSKQGAQLVNRSGETLQEIVGGGEEGHATSSREINAASEEQASGIEQINSAVAQMDKTTQQNAAMVEEATAAAESMNEQARAMGELISFFHFSVGGDDRHRRRRARATRGRVPPRPHAVSDGRTAAAAPARSLKVASAEASVVGVRRRQQQRQVRRRVERVLAR